MIASRPGSLSAQDIDLEVSNATGHPGFSLTAPLSPSEDDALAAQYAFSHSPALTQAAEAKTHSDAASAGNQAESRTPSAAAAADLPAAGSGPAANKKFKAAVAKTKQLQTADGEEKRPSMRMDEVVMTAMAATKFKKKKAKVVTKLHSHFEVTLAIMIGIRDSVTRYGDVAREELKPNDFAQASKVFYPTEGTKETEAHSLSSAFEFKDYAGKMFAKFRHMHGIKPADYLQSLASNLPYLDFLTNSKSGQFFFFSNDRKYLIKTQPKSESVYLRRFLQSYYAHMVSNPHSLLVPLYGMHRIKFKDRSVHFIIMRNMFPADKQVHKKYDLKGSSLGRSASDRERLQLCPVLKDLDFSHEYLDVGERKKLVVKQLDADAAFLRTMNIMDYSLLVGIHYPGRQQDRQALAYSYRDEYVAAQPHTDLKDHHLLRFAEVLSRQGLAAIAVTPSSAAHTPADEKKGPEPSESTQQPKGPVPRIPDEDDWKQLEDGGIPSEADAPEEAVFYMGIIDILQEYNARKKAEHFFKTIRHSSDEVSAVNPKLYAQRFVKFIESHLR